MCSMHSKRAYITSIYLYLHFHAMHIWLPMWFQMREQIFHIHIHECISVILIWYSFRNNFCRCTHIHLFVFGCVMQQWTRWIEEQRTCISAPHTIANQEHPLTRDIYTYTYIYVYSINLGVSPQTYSYIYSSAMCVSNVHCADFSLN